MSILLILCFFFFQAEDGIRDRDVTGVQTCALPILSDRGRKLARASVQEHRVYDEAVERASQIISWSRHNRRAGSYASAAELSYPPIPHSAAIFSIWAKSRMDDSPSRKIVASKGSCGRCVITRSTAV